jgi:subtilisin family serine protease
VAGTIAAVTNNANGVAGVAYGAKVQPVRALGRCGGYTSDIADGIIWASGGTVTGLPVNSTPARVINLSLGGSGACDDTTRAAVDGARGRGAVVVVAAGNSNVDVSNSSPANCQGVIAVAAVDRSGGKAYYSNFGLGITLAAPGGDMRSSGTNGVLSTWNLGTTTPGADAYAFSSGTSMATPHVSAVAALMFSANPGLKPGQVKQLLKSSARAFPATCSQCGAGIVDAGAAVSSALAALHPSLVSSANPSVAGGVVTFTVTVTGDTFKMALFKVGVAGTYGAATTNYTDMTGNSDETSGTGYSAGGTALTNVDPVASSPSAYTTFSPNPSWTSATLTSAGVNPAIA